MARATAEAAISEGRYLKKGSQSSIDTSARNCTKTDNINNRNTNKKYFTFFTPVGKPRKRWIGVKEAIQKITNTSS